MLKALLYAYVLGGITFIPLVIAAAIFYSIYTSVPVPVRTPNVVKNQRYMEADGIETEKPLEDISASPETNDLPRTRKGWLTMRRTFEESAGDGGYVTLVRSFLDARSKDPKKSRPKDMWYAVLKGKVLYLYEDEDMTECGAAVELSGHQVIIYPEGLPDGELFAKRNAICLRLKGASSADIPNSTKEDPVEKVVGSTKSGPNNGAGKKREAQREGSVDDEKRDVVKEAFSDPSSPWYIFARSTVEMEDWYLALIHASEQLVQTPTLAPLHAVFQAADMNHLVSTLDEQPDVIPMRWLNALLGRIFFSHYRTHNLEAFIIGRLMKKLSKVKRPAFLTEIAVTEVSVGNKTPMLSKPMLKELTKEGDASLEVHLFYKGEIRLTLEATAVINLGARFKSYTVKLVLAAVLKELEGNLLIKVKRPPSNRIWYAFTQTPRMVLELEPIVSDRQLTWGMILSTIESKFREIIQESVVMPNMDDISFFESGSYEHRGGIWSDACRKFHPRPVSTPEDVQSVASAPLPDTGMPGFPSECIAPVVSKSMDDIDFTATLPSTTVTADKPSHSVPTVLEESSDPFHIPDSSRNSARRRTWFSSLAADDLGMLSSSNHVADVNQPEALEPRGRSVENGGSLRPTRSNSYSSKSESTRAVTPDRSEDEHEPSQPATYLSPHSSRRSSSQHSVRLEQGSSNQETPNLHANSIPTTPNRNSDASQIGRSPSPPSFFSALKSKAADKQAISNTAKEAMRKWGVNWTGFIKKDAASDESSRSHSPPRLGSPLEDNFSHKARASYAEVRAAVAERRERERTAHVDDNSDALRPSSPSATDKPASTGVPSNSLLPNESVYSDTPINPSIVTSAARLSATRLSSKKSTPSMGRVTAELDAQELLVTEEPVKSPPILVQPQAKTMSIPGIHASHRGEVQSMGYVVPQLQSTPASPSENMLKNPTIQSVYRLWKTPSGSGPETETRTLSEDSSTPVTAPLPPSQPAVKPTPPPLPPRSSPMAVPRAGTDTSADVFSSPSSSASQALKTIALKDERIRRASIEGTLTPPSSEPAVQDSSNPVPTLDREDFSITLETSANLQTVTEGKSPPPLPPRRTPIA
ncbi:hypothetical protein BYT27DRAFT_7139590 [Phlegmacium glaucopus]|nr:hypothetical protein BYT27DRAFT_7139590 [Phlegmacium glaucopus]